MTRKTKRLVITISAIALACGLMIAISVAVSTNIRVGGHCTITNSAGASCG